ncbi:MAG: flavodoxin family protein [Lachnospiraceae bacterium]
MKVLAINGSPRKTQNTAALLTHALNGAIAQGAKTELIHLFDLRYTGCKSCFACKRKVNALPGQCVVQDGLTSVLEKAMACDVLLLGSPIYFGNITGQMRSFLERLAFMNLSYDEGRRSYFEGKISSAFFFTMNLPKSAENLYRPMFESNARLLELLGGSTEYMAAYNTYQFDDYSKYYAGRFDEARKAAYRKEQFPLDCEQAYEIGARLATLAV